MSIEKVNVTVRLAPDAVAFLDELALTQERDRSYFIKKAVEDYIAYERWRMKDIRKAIEEADAGLFATDEEVEAFFSKPIK